MAAPSSLFRCAFARAFWIGEAYGGGFLPLIASQSKGCDADNDGDNEGEWTYDTLLRGVVVAPGKNRPGDAGPFEDIGEFGSLWLLPTRGELVADAALLN